MTPEQQRQFSQSLAGAPHSPPLQLFNGAKADTAQRFEVYLNNVRSARVDALRQSFPARALHTRDAKSPIGCVPS